MSMTVVVTRNVRTRVRGFLSSVMLEVSPGVYVAPRISPAVRTRVWDIMNAWFSSENDASIVMLWQDADRPGGQSVNVLGAPAVQLVDVDGIVLSRRSVS